MSPGASTRTRRAAPRGPGESREAVQRRGREADGQEFYRRFAAKGNQWLGAARHLWSCDAADPRSADADPAAVALAELGPGAAHRQDSGAFRRGAGAVPARRVGRWWAAALGRRSWASSRASPIRDAVRCTLADLRSRVSVQQRKDTARQSGKPVSAAAPHPGRLTGLRELAGLAALAG
ncbi:hypothetical protein GCM10010304_76280 [Streptomyces roseoviolaceus]